MGASLNVAIGGLVVNLVCPDPALERRIQSSFHCLSGSQKPIMTLAVHICSRRTKADAPSASRRLPARASRLAATIKDIRVADPKSSSLAVMDGEGEYAAAFDPAARRGFIRLTSSNATLALANFIRRIFARLVIDHNGTVFHCACVVRKRPGFAGGCAEASGAYIFFGKSGSGKSTVCELSCGDTIVSDDLTVVRVMGGRLLAWGLPAFRPGYAGALRPGESPPYQLSQGVFPIRAAFTLVKDSQVCVKRLRAANALASMLAFPSDLSEPEPVGKIVDLLTRLVHTVPCYELHFSKDRAFWNVIDAEVTDKVQRHRDTKAQSRNRSVLTL